MGVGLALVAAGAVTLVAAFESRVRPSSAVRRIGNGAAVGGAVVLVAAGLLGLGGPSAIAKSFAADTTGDGADLNERLFSLSGNGRVEQWRVALDDAFENPVLGSGAGSFKRYWLEHRPGAWSIRDAHTLYIEMLAELGPVGLALILAVFGFPLVLAVRARHRPLVPIAAAVLVAFLARAAIDWDWEFPVLTLVALACASVIVAEATDASDPIRRSRIALLATVVACVPLVAVVTVGNRAAGSRCDCLRRARLRTFGERSRESRATRAVVGRAARAPGTSTGGGWSSRGSTGTFERVVAREPDHWRAWFELAAVSAGAEREAALRRARALNPLEWHIEDLDEGP